MVLTFLDSNDLLVKLRLIVAFFVWDLSLYVKQGSFDFFLLGLGAKLIFNFL